MLDKENSLRAPVALVYLLIQILPGLCTSFLYLPYDPVTCDIMYDITCDVTVTPYLTCDVTQGVTSFPMLLYKREEKEKEKKRILNIDLAVGASQ